MRADKSDASRAIPDRIGRYEVLLPIASGGMATVYLARSRGVGGFERDVALKLTHAHLRETPEFAADLIEEAKLAVKIRHPNVVPVLDVGEDPWGLYLVMEYVEGDSLSGLLRRARSVEGGMPIPIALRVLGDSLAGLHAAHELCDDAGRSLGVVHRDFSPQNILVGADGSSRLADFGIAKAASRVGMTQSGTVKGKMGYMSPEQACAQPLDRRCDVWAAGVIAWEIFAGRRLYPSDSVATLLQIATKPAPRLSSVRADTPAEVDDAIAWALTTELDERCPTAAALHKRLLAAGREHFGVAESSEVGQYVSALVGPKLAERRARIAEVIALRAKMGALTVADHDSISSASGAAASPVLASAQQSPALLPSEPPTRLRTAAAPPAVADVGDDQAAESAREAATTNNAISVSTPDAIAAVRERRWRARGGRRALLVAAGVLAVAAGVWLVPPSDDPVTEESNGVDVAPATVVEQPTRSDDSAAPSATAAASATTAPSELRVTANAPIAALRVNGRRIALAAPTAVVRVELSARQTDGGHKLEATSSDGRKASITVAADASTAALRFPTVTARPPGKAPPISTRRPY